MVEKSSCRHWIWWPADRVCFWEKASQNLCCRERKKLTNVDLKKIYVKEKENEGYGLKIKFNLIYGLQNKI
jgi:hypothetical protein